MSAAAIGDTFGLLTLTAPLPNDRNGYGRRWLCACRCGGTCERLEAKLRQAIKLGRGVSCGCLMVRAQQRYAARFVR